MAAPTLILHVRTLCLEDNGGRRWRTRSAAPLRLLAVLWLLQRTRSAPITLSEVAPYLGTTAHPRQMQRIIDWLESTGLGLVGFETRTAGRYWLACAPDKLSFDRTAEELTAWLGAGTLLDGAPRPAAIPETQTTRRDLARRVDHLLHADSGFHDGRLSGSPDAAHELLTTVAPPDDAVWRASWLLRQATVAMRMGDFSRFDTLAHDLTRDIRTGKRRHDAHIETRLALLRAKAQYDRGNDVEAERHLHLARIEQCSDVWTRGRYFNYAGLVAFRRWRKSLREGALPYPQIADGLARIESHYSEALACQLQVMDYQGIQATTFNLANACLTPLIERQPLPGDLARQWLDGGLEWIRLCRVTCTHFFVGMDSAWGQILMLEVALATGEPFAPLNEKAGRIFGKIDTLPGAMRYTLEMARKLGNPAEIAAAEALARQIK